MSAPRIEFHSGIADPLRYACRLLRKAWRQDVRVAIIGPQPLLQALDRELWTFEANEFVPHRQVSDEAAGDAEALRRVTPIWLCAGEVPTPGPKVLVNLGSPLPTDPGRFERIVELVGTGDGDRRAARARWRDYEARGWAIQHHERAQGG